MIKNYRFLLLIFFVSVQYTMLDAQVAVSVCAFHRGCPLDFYSCIVFLAPLLLIQNWFSDSRDVAKNLPGSTLSRRKSPTTGIWTRRYILLWHGRWPGWCPRLFFRFSPISSTTKQRKPLSGSSDSLCHDAGKLQRETHEHFRQSMRASFNVR